MAGRLALAEGTRHAAQKEKQGGKQAGKGQENDHGRLANHLVEIGCPLGDIVVNLEGADEAARAHQRNVGFDNGKSEVFTLRRFPALFLQLAPRLALRHLLEKIGFGNLQPDFLRLGREDYLARRVEKTEFPQTKLFAQFMHVAGKMWIVLQAGA